MRQPVHSMLQPGARWTTERIVGAGFVALLHVIVIWAILSGLMQKFVKPADPPPITWTQPIPYQPPPQQAPLLPHVEPTGPTTTVAIPPPQFTIQQPAPPQAGGSIIPLTPPQPPVTDTYASGIAGTHTIPDYPSLARRLSEQGSVRLSLTISPDGNVIAANVSRSSGFPDLDDAAVNWVLGHWKYKPATHLGAAVASQTQAVVVFNLKNIR